MAEPREPVRDYDADVSDASDLSVSDGHDEGAAARGSVGVLIIAHLAGLAGIAGGVFWVAMTFAFEPFANVLAFWPLAGAYAFYALTADLAGRATKYPAAIHGNRIFIVVILILITLLLLPSALEMTSF